jgi:predicted permease
MRNELRNALRSLVRDKGFAATCVLKLAIGIGANAVIFSIVNSILLRPLAYREPGRLVYITEVVPELSQMYPRLPVSPRHFLEWRRRLSSFDQLSLLDYSQAVLTRAGEPERVTQVRCSANLLPSLGFQPQLGRGFREDEDRPGNEHVALISDSLWERRFHRDPNLLGKSVTLDGQAYAITGVLPADFHLPNVGKGIFEGLPRKVDVLKPFALREEKLDWFGPFNYVALGRLKPGVSVPAALAEMNVTQAAIAQRIPEKMHLRAAITPLAEEVIGPARLGLMVLLGAVGAVLLIACVNLANLSLARATSRGRDFAIRAALGAGRLQLIRERLTESVCLSLIGGAAGYALAWAGLRSLLAAAPIDLPRIEEVHLDARVFWFAFALSALTGVLFGLLPAWRASSADPQDALRSGSRTATEGRGGLRTREALVALEVGLSAALLIAAGLLTTSFVRLLNVDKGFEAPHLLAAKIGLPRNKYPDVKTRDRYYTQLLTKLRNLPGVTSAAVASQLPLEGETWVSMVRREGDKRPLVQLPVANYRFISPEYFQTMGIPMVAGRMFGEGDRGRSVAVISEKIAREVWRGENPIGRKFYYNGEDESISEIVGVVKDTLVGLDKKPVMAGYIPYWELTDGDMTAVLSAAMDPRAAAPALRGAVWSVDPEVVLGELRTMEQVISNSVAQRRFQMLLIVAFAVTALLLAAIGIYGVVAWSVARRKNEIGIRMALGARASGVRGMVLREGLRPVAFGLAAGVGLAAAMGRIMASFLFGVTAHDPATIAEVSVLLLGVGSLACLIPAHRATSAEPLDALRYE